MTQKAVRTWTLIQAGWSDAVDDFVVDGPDVGPPNTGEEPTVRVNDLDLDALRGLLERWLAQPWRTDDAQSLLDPLPKP